MAGAGLLPPRPPAVPPAPGLGQPSRLDGDIPGLQVSGLHPARRDRLPGRPGAVSVPPPSHGRHDVKVEAICVT